MLTKLNINNYAIIDNLEIDFHKGFSVITGETGAGKSIIMGALGLITGERFDTKVLKNKDKKSIVEAEFNLCKLDLTAFFKDNDLDYDSELCVIRRELAPNGRSRAFVNDSPVGLSLLKTLSLSLIDIHSQQSNGQLNSPSFQLAAIDSISESDFVMKQYYSKYIEYVGLYKHLSELKIRAEKARQDEEYNKFLLGQIEPLHLVDGEDSELEDVQSKLTNVSDIKSTLWDFSQTYNNDRFNLVSELKNSISKLSRIKDWVKEIPEILDRLESVSIELKDISFVIDNINDSINDDPAELERVNDRLSQIYELERKYNLNSVKELLLLQNDLSSKISMIGDADFEIEKIEREIKSIISELSVLSNQLSELRKDGADNFVKQIKEKAITLGLRNINCQFNFEKTDFTPTGCDKVLFMVSFNKNQEMMPLSTTASGGELSRMMLCIKSVIASKMQLPTIIFDEIDTGVSGDIANKMGSMMKEMSCDMQVMSITHLPQVAAIGNFQYKVYKEDNDDSTVTNIKELTRDERIVEIAGMLAAGEINKAAVDNAKSLLNFN